MNSNRIDLADIYGLNRPEKSPMYSNTMNTPPPSLEQLTGVYDMSGSNNMNNENMDNENMDNVNMNNANTEMIMSGDRPAVSGNMNNEVDKSKCESGRCRFSSIPHQHNMETEDCAFCHRDNFMPITEYDQPYPITAQNIQYLNTFIRSQIGRRVHVEFLIGTNNMVEKDGYLVAVGANFILLNPVDTRDMIACDFYNIKFMKFYY